MSRVLSAEEDAMLDRAQAEGRFGAARRPMYARLLADDPQRARVLLTASPADGELAAGLGGAATLGGPAYPEGFLTDAERRQRTGTPRPPSGGARITSET